MSVRSLLAEIEIADADGVVIGGRNGIRFCFELHIAGLFAGPPGEEDSLRLYSGPHIADAPGGGSAVGVRYAQAIVDVEPYKARFDGFKGWVSAGSTRVTLRPTRDYPLDDLAVLASGVPYRGELITEIPEALEPPFEVEFRDSDPANWPPSGTLCVGLEVMLYEVDAGVMSIVDRGTFGSPQQRHRVDPTRGTYPLATSKIIAWEGRPVELYLSVERADGTRAPDKIELVAGYLEGQPDGDDPSEMTVVGAPWVAALEKKVGGRDAFTGLQHGWKVFADGDLGRTLTVEQRYPRNAYVEVPSDVGIDGKTLENTHGVLHAAIFDLEADGALQGELEMDDGTRNRVAEYSDPDDFIVVAEDLVGGAWVTVRSVEATISRTAQVAADGEVAVRWPQAAVLAVAQQLQPRSHFAGLAVGDSEPAFVDMRLDLEDPAFHCTATGRGMQPPELILTPYRPGTAWYAIDVADPEDPNFARPIAQFSEQQQRRSMPAPRSVSITASRGDRQAGRVVVPLRGVADAWWSGETWIHVESDRPFPAPPFVALVEWDERGEARRTTPRIVSVTAASNIFPGVPGYLLETDPEDRQYRYPFGDWDGERSVKIRASINARDVGPGRLLLMLLTSRLGDQSNGPYDQLPFGAGIPWERVSTPSFRGFPVDALIGDISDIDLTESQELGVLIGGTLRAMRAQIVEHLNLETGKRQLFLEPADLALATEAIGVHISDGRWYRRARPGTKNDRRVVNRIDYEANFVDGKPTVGVSVVDDGLINEAGGQEHIVTEKLRGVRVQPGAAATQEAQLRSIAAARFAAHGRARRILAGALPATDMLRTAPGAIVLVSSATSRDVDGTLGVAGRAAQIVDWELDPWRMECRVGLALGAELVRGYGPTLRVVGIDDDFTVVVARNAYTSTVHRRTGLELRDVDYWRLGQRCRFIRPGVTPRRFPAAGAWATITLIDRDADLVRFNIEHDFDAGRLGWVDLPVYADADPEDQARWCWIGLSEPFRYS